MIDYASWFYRQGRINCIDCREIKAESGNIPDCKTCGKVDIIPENYLTFGLVEKFSGILLDGYGGIQAKGIEIMLDAENIPMEMRSDIIQKVIVFLNAAIAARSNTNG